MKRTVDWILWGVRLAALWVLAGALAKTFTGLPGDLPAPILQLNVDPLLVIVFAVAVESFIALLALFAPRYGSIPLAALLALFGGILILHVQSGAENCGCFGGALPLPGWVMIAIDLALFVFALAASIGTKRLTAPRRINLTCAAIAVVSIALAMVADSRLSTFQPREAGRSRSQTSQSPSTFATTVTVQPWKLPAEIPAQVLLRPLQWIGKSLATTELGRWTDTSRFPDECTVLIYYLSCSHCAAHLKELAQQQLADPSKAPAYVMVQLPTPAGYTGRMFVQELPTGLRVELPSAVKAWVITPPWDVFVSGGVVVRAQSVPREPSKK